MDWPSLFKISLGLFAIVNPIGSVPIFISATSGFMSDTGDSTSYSPRRVELLKQIGLDCKIFPADIDESQLLDESPVQYVTRLAREKAAACTALLAAEHLDYPILAADTTVALSSAVLGKPVDDDDARAMLNSLVTYCTGDSSSN